MRSLDGNELFELLDLHKPIEKECFILLARLRLQEVGFFRFFILVNLLDDSEQRNYSPEHLDVFDSEL